MKLISMTDFVLGTESILDKHNPIGYNEDKQSRYIGILNYAKFLKQPLKLEMFVPCDNKGNVLHKYISEPYDRNKFYDLDVIVRAKEKVLFKGFSAKVADWCDDLVIELENNKNFSICYNFEEDVFTDNVGEWLKYSTIEDLCLYTEETAEIIELNQNAIKQFM